MNRSSKNFIDRLRAGINSKKSEADDITWIQENTTIQGRPFSFLNHEYQLPILRSKHRIKYCRKCSQLGISEIAVRRVISKSQRYAGVNTMYALPTATFASKFSSTRLQTALDSSKAAKEALHRTDSALVKRFFNESFIYMQGCSNSGQVISIPVDFLVVDEKDFAESQALVSSLTSRLTHSPHKDQFHFSTPTVNGYGISDDYDNSLQHVEIQKCNHCNHTFVPDYYENVALPGFNRTKEEGKKKLPQHQTPGGAQGIETFVRKVDETADPAIQTLKTSIYDRKLTEFNHTTRALLKAFPIDEAYLECPKCRRRVDQSLQFREWIRVNEQSWPNPEDIDTPVGFQITPFSAPAYIDAATKLPNGIPPSAMIKTSAQYVDQKDFVNYCLGLPFDDATTGLGEDELRALFCNPTTTYLSTDGTEVTVPLFPNEENVPFQVSGTDLGGTCAHIKAYPVTVMTGRGVGEVSEAIPQEHLRIMSLQRIPLTQLRQRYFESIRSSRVISSVMDGMPYTDTVLALQERDSRLFACLFGAMKNSMELFRHKEQEDDVEKATYGLRQITARKDAMMDYVVSYIRKGLITIAPTQQNMQEMGTFIKHLRDPKRIKVSSEDGKGRYTWRKSDKGEDHYFLALVYLILANQIKALSGPVSPLPMLATKVKLKTEV